MKKTFRLNHPLNEAHYWESGVYWFAKSLVKAILDTFYVVEYRNCKQLVDNKSTLYIANHQSYFDPPLVGIAVEGKELFFLGKKELSRGIFKNIAPKLRMLPVDRDKPEIKVFRKIIEIFQWEDSLTVFPEGTRSKTGEIGKGKPGIAWIVEKIKPQIQPIRVFKIISNDACYPKVIFRVIAGKPISFNELVAQLGEKPSKEEISQALMGEIEKIELG